jgi:hypothetical protein
LPLSLSMDLGSAGSIARALGVWGEDHQREDLEQYLRADHYGVAGRVVLRATSTTSPPMREHAGHGYARA